MTSDFREDQAEQLRKHFDDKKDDSSKEMEIDVLSLPSRKEKYNQRKEAEKVKKEGQATSSERRRRRRLKFPLVRFLLVLFLLLVTLVITYPSWIDRL